MNDQILQARKIIGLFVKTAREERKLSKLQLAEKLNIKKLTVSKIESGKFNFSIDLFNKLSIALNFKMDFILKDEENIKGRFDLIQEGHKCTVLDKQTGIRILFRKQFFNESQEVLMPKNPTIPTSEIATTMRQIGDWLFENYNELL